MIASAVKVDVPPLVAPDVNIETLTIVTDKRAVDNRGTAKEGVAK